MQLHVWLMQRAERQEQGLLQAWHPVLPAIGDRPPEVSGESWERCASWRHLKTSQCRAIHCCLGDSALQGLGGLHAAADSCIHKAGWFPAGVGHLWEAAQGAELRPNEHVPCTAGGVEGERTLQRCGV